jgi:hypothetical protein
MNSLTNFDVSKLQVKWQASIFVCLLLLSCQNNINNENRNSSMNYDNRITQNEYGKPITDEKIYQVKDIFSDSFKITEDSSITLNGRIKEICKIKGCWIDLVDLDDTHKVLFVQFPENSFTLPTSIENAEVLATGKLIKEIITVEDQIYEAEKTGKTTDEIAAIISPKEKISFLAEGIKIRKL